MEDDLKILKVEYLSNHWLDLTRIWNLRLGDQTKLYKCVKWRQPRIEDDLKILKMVYLSNHQSKVFRFFKWRRPPIEEDLNILKVEYLSNHQLDPTQILNLSLYDQTMFCKSSNKDDLQWKMTSKYWKRTISAITWILDDQIL